MTVTMEMSTMETAPSLLKMTTMEMLVPEFGPKMQTPKFHQRKGDLV